MNAKEPVFHRRPLVAAALGLLLGILLGRAFNTHICGIAAMLIAVLATFLILRKYYRLLPFALFLLVGLLRTLPDTMDATITQSSICALSGTVSDTPAYQDGQWRMRLTRAELNGDAVHGDILLTLMDETKQLAPQYNDQIALNATVHPIQNARNEGGFQAYDYYRGKGVSYTAYSADGDAQLRAGGNDIYGVLLSFRERLRVAVYDMLGNEYGALAEGMLLGETDHIDDTSLAAFRDGGISHLLAVSGLHVTLLCAALGVLLKRARYRVRLGIIGGFLIVYCLITGLSPSALRASIMTVCLLLSQGAQRRNDPPSSLALAFLLLALWNPYLIFSASLQLSFGAVGGILLFVPVLESLFSFLPGVIGSALSVSCGAQLGTLPFLATQFHRFSLFGVFINLLVVPLASLVLLPLIVSLLLYPLIPAAALFFAGIAKVTLALIKAAAVFSAGFGTIALPAFSFGATVLYCAACVLISDICLLRLRHKAVLSMLCLVLCALLVLMPIAARPAAYVSVLHCRQGYAIHLHAPGSDQIITDGSTAARSAAEDYIAALCISNPAVHVSKQHRQEIRFGEYTIAVDGAFVSIGNAVYSLAQTGRLRIHLRQGSIFVSAYAILNHVLA